MMNLKALLATLVMVPTLVSTQAYAQSNATWRIDKSRTNYPQFDVCNNAVFATREEIAQCYVRVGPTAELRNAPRYYNLTYRDANGTCRSYTESTVILRGNGRATTMTPLFEYQRWNGSWGSYGFANDGSPLYFGSCDAPYIEDVGIYPYYQSSTDPVKDPVMPPPPVNEDASCRKGKDSTFRVAIGNGSEGGGVFARVPIGKWLISCGVGNYSMSLGISGVGCDADNRPQCESKVTACSPLAANEHAQAAARGSGLTAYVCQTRAGDKPADAEVVKPASSFSIDGVVNTLVDVGILDADLHRPGDPIQTEKNADGSTKLDPFGRPVRYAYADMTVLQYCNVLKAADPSIYCGADYAGVGYPGVTNNSVITSSNDVANTTMRVKVDYTNAPTTLNYTLNQPEYYCRDNPNACTAGATFNPSLSWSPTSTPASQIGYTTNNTLVRYEQTGTKDGKPSYVVTYVNNDNRSTTTPPQTTKEGGGAGGTVTNPVGTKTEDATFNADYCDSLLEKIGARLGLSACIVEPDSVNIVEKTLQPVVGVDCGAQPDGTPIPCQNTSQVWSKKLLDNPDAPSTRFMSQFSFPSDNPGDRSDFSLGHISIPCFSGINSCPNHNGEAGVWYGFDVVIPGWLLDILGVAIRLYGTYLMFTIIVG